MNYEDFEKHLSKPRLDKYRRACGGNEQKAVELHTQNIELSKNFYGVLSLFELALRNAINEHYKSYFLDKDWILHQYDCGLFREPQMLSIAKAKKKLNTFKFYSPDNLVAELAFGFWINMFSSHCFKNGDQTLLKIFPNRYKDINQKLIYKELDEIRDFRNRIAHHEPICFNINGKVSLKYGERIWRLMLKYSKFLGLPDEFLQSVEVPTLLFRA